MGLLSFLRRKDERAIPAPGTPEFDAMVAGSAIPDGQSVAMGEGGWASTSSKVADTLEGLGLEAERATVEETRTQTVDLTNTEAREQVEDVLREHGIDPSKQGQTVDASTVPGLQRALLAALGMAGLKIPNSDGIGGGISPPRVDPLAQVEHLAAKRDAGEISDAEFEAQKRKLLGS